MSIKQWFIDGNSGLPEWPRYWKLVFRIIFIFFILLVVPLDWQYYRFVFTTNWISFNFQDWFRLSSYFPGFIPQSQLPVWNLAAFSNIGIIALIALAGGIVWSFSDKETKSYYNLFYWLRVLVRYRLAIAVAAYGILKLFKLQLPFPSLSDLNTEYGYFLKWRIYYLTTGASAAYYEQSLGLIEIIAGLLLIFRKTALIGAGLIAILLSNIILANFAYQIGNQVYAVYLILLAFLLIAYDGSRLYRLLVLEKPAQAAIKPPGLKLQNKRNLAHLILIVFILIDVTSGFAKQRSNWGFSNDKGFKNKEGLYNVSYFSINKDTLPYSTADPLRWRNVVIEKWNTISIKDGRQDSLNIDIPDRILRYDNPQDYEQAGNLSRTFYRYSADTVHNLLILHDKNTASDSLNFNYKFPDDSTIELSGTNIKNDSLHIVLNRIPKKYLLIEGHRKPIKVY